MKWCDLLPFFCDRGNTHDLFAIQRFNFMVVAISQKLIYFFFDRVATKGRVLSPCTSNLGTLTLWPSWTCVRTMARRNKEPVTFSMPFGSRTCSWNVSKSSVYGALCVLMSARVWPIAGAKNLKHFTPSMKKRVNFANRSRPRMCGQLSLTHRLKRVHHTCSTKMLATENPINKILAPSSAPIFAQKSLNTAAQTRYVGSNYTC